MEAAVGEPAVGGRRLPTLSLSDLEEPLRYFDQGGFGEIYRSRMWGGLDVALKLVRGTRQAEKELIKEARLMEQAQYVYVLPLLAFYRNPEGDCVKYGLVTKYMPNGSLCTLFRKVSPVPWALRFRIIHQVALGMHYLHALKPPLLHRDLKRSNILLDENLKVQLADFGLSKSEGITESSSAGKISGTLAYMPPEAFVFGNKKNESFDIYSFGVLTWTVLAAREPYQGALDCQILLSVQNGQRPDLEPVESQSNVKMVPEARDLMKRCWDPEAAERPPFRICIGKTEVMLKAYADEVDNAVRCVQDILKKKQEEALDPQRNPGKKEKLRIKENSKRLENIHAMSLQGCQDPQSTSLRKTCSQIAGLGSPKEPRRKRMPEVERRTDRKGNQKAATQSTGTVETDSTYPFTDSFHPSIFRTEPKMTPLPSTEPTAAAPSQRRTTNTGLSSPATPKVWSKTGSMEQFLGDNFVQLRDKIPGVQPMLDQLTEERIFTREEVETILAKETLTDRIRTMLLAIQKKGERSSKRFCHLLNEAYPNVLSSFEDS